jgi:hypothetical protein
LVTLLAEGRYRAAGIDAPFALPERHMPPEGHGRLLADLAAMPPGLLDAVLSELVKRSGAAVLSRPSLRLRVVEGGRG